MKPLSSFTSGLLQIMLDPFKNEFGWNQTRSSFPPEDIIFKDNGDLVFQLAVAGFKKDDFEITYDKDFDNLIIEGSTKKVKQDNDIYVKETLNTRSFQKSYGIRPKKAMLNVDNITSSYEDGILTVTIHADYEAIEAEKKKREEAIKKIEVK